jgi:hypothetical protein
MKYQVAKEESQPALLFYQGDSGKYKGKVNLLSMLIGTLYLTISPSAH